MRRIGFALLVLALPVWLKPRAAVRKLCSLRCARIKSNPSTTSGPRFVARGASTCQASCVSPVSPCGWSDALQDGLRGDGVGHDRMP